MVLTSPKAFNNRSNVVSGATFGFWLDKAEPEDCNTSFFSFLDNTAHSNSVGGVLITADACTAPGLPTASLGGLIAYKHSSSGILMDNLEGAELQDSLFVDNDRYGLPMRIWILPQRVFCLSGQIDLCLMSIRSMCIP